MDQSAEDDVRDGVEPLGTPRSPAPARRTAGSLAIPYNRSATGRKSSRKIGELKTMSLPRRQARMGWMTLPARKSDGGASVYRVEQVTPSGPGVTGRILT